MTEKKLHEQTAKEWAEELFECENCAECGKGANDHDILNFLGNWFARCQIKEEE